MPKLLSAYATPFVTGLFLISTISGLALFFHVGPRGFRGMHEWLSLVLLALYWHPWLPVGVLIDLLLLSAVFLRWPRLP